MAEISLSQLLLDAPANPPAGPEPIETVQGGVSRAFTVDQLGVFYRRTPVNNQTGASYTLGISDAGTAVRCNSSSGVAVTVPVASSVAFKVGDVVAVRQVGTGAVSIGADSGVTINVPAGFLAQTGRQGATVIIHCVAQDEWDMTGDLVSA